MHTTHSKPIVLEDRPRTERRPLIVDITAADVVWVEATADGTRLLYTRVNPGERHVIEVREWLLLRVANAGAFRYSINGVRGRPLGAGGEVTRVRITHDNVAWFQAPVFTAEPLTDFPRRPLP